MRRRGERKQEILITVARMLEAPAAEKITTASLAARLGVSEAALYRHFASKAQMYEGLIEFIENGLFSTVNRIQAENSSGLKQARLILTLLLGFAQKNPGLTRVLTGEALVGEDPRLQARVDQLLDRLEATVRQALKVAHANGEALTGVEPAEHADIIVNFVLGRWQQYVRSGFKRDPSLLSASQWHALVPDPD